MSRLSALVLGLVWGWLYFLFQPDMPLRLAGGRLVETPWWGVTIFFGLPVLIHFAAGRWLCSRPLGPWLVGGWLLFNAFWLVPAIDDYSHLGRAFIGCGNGIRRWYQSSYLLPACLGLALSLLRLDRLTPKRVDQNAKTMIAVP